MAAWVIGYGIVQASAPKFVKKSGAAHASKAALVWGLILTLIAVAIALLVQLDQFVLYAVLGGLLIYGIVFAINSALHSYLILAFTDDDQVSLNVGFYYMANACGRLLGTLASGLSYHYGGLQACLWVSAAMLAVASYITIRLPRNS